MEESRISARITTDITVEPEEPVKQHWFKQSVLALRYEHSLFRLSRFGFNFARFQSVAVFFAVVIASFGGVTLIFELRSDQYQISVVVTVAV